MTYPEGISDEGVWVGNSGDGFASSIEGGFITGTITGGAWESRLVPYWTFSNPQDETVYTANPLPTGTPISMYVTSAYGSRQASALLLTYSGTNFSAYVDGGGYTVATPREPYFQGEAQTCYPEAYQSYMGGGGNPLTFNLLYESASSLGTFYYWGTQNADLYNLGSYYHESNSGAYTTSNWGQ